MASDSRPLSAGLEWSLGSAVDVTPRSTGSTPVPEFLGNMQKARPNTDPRPRPAGSHTPARLLIEAAQHYRKQPAITQLSLTAKVGQDPRVTEIAWRAQRRLHQRWAHLHYRRNNPGQQVTIAVARALAAFRLEAATLNA